jgi:hypothetical protein
MQAVTTLGTIHIKRLVIFKNINNDRFNNERH